MNNIKCEICEKRFVSTRNLNNHIKNNCLPEQNLICKKCGKKFSDMRGMKTHLRVKNCSNGTKRYDCDKCGKDFKTDGRLQAHQKRKTSCEKIVGDPTGIISETQCHFCMRNFKSFITLKNHFGICKIRNGDMDEFKKKYEQMEKENKENKERLDKLQKQIDCLSKGTGTKTITDKSHNNNNAGRDINNVNNTNIINILNTPETMKLLEKHIGSPINCFDNPNTDYIGTEEKNEMLDGAVFPEITSRFTGKVYTNSDHPENHSIIMVDVSRGKLVGLQLTLKDGEVYKCWRPLSSEKLYAVIKKEMKKAFDPKIYPEIAASISKRTITQFNPASRGLKDTKPQMEDLLYTSKLLKLEKHGFCTNRVIEYKLGELDPEDRVQILLLKEWCEEAPSERRNIYLKRKKPIKVMTPEDIALHKEWNIPLPVVSKEPDMAMEWDGKTWSSDEFLTRFATTVRNLTKAKCDEIDDERLHEIIKERLIKNTEFLEKHLGV
jgi:hypothetical protein